MRGHGAGDYRGAPYRFSYLYQGGFIGLVRSFPRFFEEREVLTGLSARVVRFLRLLGVVSSNLSSSPYLDSCVFF